MPSTNFDLAPPSKTLDGLLAVPIDIQSISAALTFDGAAQTGSGDATLAFIVGPQSGNPIFDLRQTVTGAWLDGAPVPVAQVAHHDFGGGPNAELRVLESVLAAGSAHTLRVTYSLGPPQASTAGTYQPAMTWSAGPRLAFNFGFTDLGAGRYLEAWIPANLIFDQFALTLEEQIVGTMMAHSVITNGAVTALGANHWSIAFPDRFTALSPLLEVRATDTLVALTDSTTLPLSGAVVDVEGWTLTTTGIDLTAQIANVKTWLGENETAIGPYLHGNRFVAFFNVGGMEYEGGMTASPSSARHETYHSWWGRGIKPAGQPDGWWDEAWNTYHDAGATGSTPFDFSQPPVELSTRNPWTRITPAASYSAGERVFEGAAAAAGIAGLASAMSSFYVERNERPATTENLESFLVCRTGQAMLVDGFHRFVYGFADSTPPPDLWLRDDPAHTGADTWGGTFWNSPDLWIRNADDGGTMHEPPEYGQDNWFYARVRNRSATTTARHYLVAFNVKPYAGIEFLYPADFLPCIAAVAGFELAPGDSTVVRARWPAALVPPPGTHACWLAAVLTRGDHPAAGAHVWEHNNLAQKNLTIVDLLPNDWIVVPFIAQDLLGRSRGEVVLELHGPQGLRGVEAWLLEPRRAHAAPDEELLDCGAPSTRGVDSRDVWISRRPKTATARAFRGAAERAFSTEPVPRVSIALGEAGQRLLGLRLHVPPDAKPGERLTIDLVQRDPAGKQPLGGLALEIRIGKRSSR
jgi:hypothetical protein